MASPKMEDFEIDNDDGPLLSQVESGYGEKTTICLPHMSSLRRRRLVRLSLVAITSIIALAIFAIGGASFSSGRSLRSALHVWPPSPQTPKSNAPIENPLKDGNSTLLALGSSYVRAIMEPEDTSFQRLECPSPTIDRYSYLRATSAKKHERDKQASYFFALDLHQCVHVLPRLMGSIVETIRFLGPENCALSVVEGRSDDGTFEVLKLLRKEIEGMGAKYFFSSNDEINPGKDNNLHRITALAELRNLALQPLIDHPEQYSTNLTVLFINDVAICMEDVLELIHQRQYQKADMTCAMDWTFLGPQSDPTFYDVWIARGMNGDSFFEIPPSGLWTSAWNLFWNNPAAQERQRSGQPFQVFSCWNGAVAFTAKPFLEQKIRFRASRESECFQGEPKLLAKDMWFHGYGKIAVIPSINLEYSDEAAKKIKAEKGYVSKWVETGAPGHDLRIEWDLAPPQKVKCIPSYENQTWPPWDEGL